MGGLGLRANPTHANATNNSNNRLNKHLNININISTLNAQHNREFFKDNITSTRAHTHNGNLRTHKASSGSGQHETPDTTRTTTTHNYQTTGTQIH